MDSMDDHIRAVGGPDLTAALARTCWPGGHADRTEPAAREWVRRWRPARSATVVPACGCSAGRCAVCN